MRKICSEKLAVGKNGGIRDPTGLVTLYLRLWGPRKGAFSQDLCLYVSLYPNVCGLWVFIILFHRQGDLDTFGLPEF
jgi:hypothetical protein